MNCTVVALYRVYGHSITKVFLDKLRCLLLKLEKESKYKKLW